MTTTTGQDSWQAAQQASLETAVNWGNSWTTEEVELVTAFMDEPVAEVAVALGRTVFAVSSIRFVLRHGGNVGGGSGRKPKREEVGYDFVTTFPPGWND